MKKIRKYLVPLLAIIIVALFICYGISKNDKNSYPIVHQDTDTVDKYCNESIAKITPANNPGDLEWTTYHNDKFGFSFNYPRKIMCVLAEQPTNPILAVRNGHDSALSLTITPWEGKTIDDHAKQMTSLPRQKFYEENRYNFAGESAVELYSDDSNIGGNNTQRKGRLTEVAFVKDKYLYVIWTQNPYGRQILETFQFE